MANREPGFFKFIAAPECFERIEIAPGYIKYKQGNLPSSVILKDDHGNHWHVQVEKHQNEFFFAKGWKTFLEENHVEVGDFIVFNYHGPNVFHVVLLGRDSCQKEGVGSLKTKVMEEEEENNEVEKGKQEGKIEREHEDTLEDSKGEPTIEDEVEFYVHEEANNYIHKEDSDNNEDEVEEIQAEEFNKASQKLKSGASGKAQIKREIQSGADKAKQACQSQEDGHGDKIFQERNISPPKNPYFVTKIRQERRNQMYIPIEVINKHNLDLPKYMLLQDPHGREWYTKLTTWSDGRQWCYGGWLSLCKENLVQQSDLLVCEFVEEKGKSKLFLRSKFFAHEMMEFELVSCFD